MSQIRSENGVSYMYRAIPYARRASREGTPVESSARTGRYVRVSSPSPRKGKKSVKPGFNRPEPADESGR